ncbi:MAG: GNAT family N-acetyltransferase [Bacteroidota bacterium]
MITYTTEETLTVAEFKDVLVRSTLGERRPIDEPDRLQEMIAQADLIVTARDNGKLVGVARSISDFAYCTYLSDLAVDRTYQKQGIGKELIRHTKLTAPQATLYLVSAPAAIPYYPRIGMEQYEHCYVLRKVEQLK